MIICCLNPKLSTCDLLKRKAKPMKYRKDKHPPKSQRRSSFFLLLIALSSPLIFMSALSAQNYEISHWTISAGGTQEATGGVWTLAGTIGQWEATPARALSGGQWRLTGGFWAAELSELGDLIFQDRFKRANQGPSSLQSGQQALNPS